MDRGRGLGKRMGGGGQRELWNFWILDLMTSETVGMFRSLWVQKKTYQGALRMVRRTLDWKLWMCWMLAGLAEPHNSTSYAQAGLRMALYILILFSRGSFDEILISRHLSRYRPRWRIWL